ncbi:MAG: glycosyltransferase, partial [Acidimicrobiales bacterium]
MASPLRVGLKPRTDLEVNPDPDYEWRVIGSRPSFEVEVDDLDTTEGWFRLRADYRADDPRRTAPVLRTVHPIGGTSRALQIATNDEIDKVFHVLSGTTALFVDVPVTTGGFTMSAPSLCPISQPEAALRMTSKVLRSLRKEPEARSTLISRTLNTIRRGGPSALRDQLVADYEGLQRRQAGPLTIDYGSWVKWHDTLDDLDRAAVASIVDELIDPPLISVVMPTYNTPERWLRRAIDSVIEQWYPHWQLCIADDASSEAHVSKILAEYAEADNRISIKIRELNGHISAASNSALRLAAGSHVALLDHDDELAPHALFLVAQAIIGDPDVDVIYSDEDKLDHRGRRVDPHFKPDYNYDLLLGQNYLSHLTVIRRALVDDVGGFRQGFEGSQDYDLVL